MRFRFGLAGTLLLAASLAWAYIPPSHFIIKGMTAKHAGVKGIRVRGTVTHYENEQPTPVHFKVMTVFQSESGVLRSWATDDVGQVYYIVDRRIEAPGMDLKSAVNTIGILLLDPHPARVSTVLRREGIPVLPQDEPSPRSMADIGKSPPSPGPADQEPRVIERPVEPLSFARWNKAITWVLGTRTPPQPQLWVEKDTFFPVRLVLDTEMQFENYRFHREFPYPRMITFLNQKKQVFRDELVEFTVNPPELAAFKNPVVTGFTDAGNAAPGAVRDLIRQYYDFGK